MTLIPTEITLRKSWASVLLSSIIAIMNPAVSAQSPDVQAPPEHPITLDQLRTLLDELHIIEATQNLTMKAAENQRKTLPVWFPQNVWDEIEKKMMAVDIAKFQLPMYQRLFSQDNADALILYFRGPEGEQLAADFLARRVAVSQTGARGSEADTMAMQQASQSQHGLGAKRLNELSPADRERVIIAQKSLASGWKPLSDELSHEYNNFMNDLVQKEIAAHNEEIVAAQQVYLRKSHAAPASAK